MTTQKLVRSAIFLSLALVFQIGFRQFAQPLVGPLINMTLILATLIVGPVAAIIIGVITPTAAFLLGIIGLPLLVPIVATGNVLFIITFSFLRKSIKFPGRDWLSIFVSSIVKFLVLFGMVRALLPLVMPKVPNPILVTFSLPQLYTALVGGIIAIILYQILPIRKTD